VKKQVQFKTLYTDYQPKIQRLVMGYVKGNEALAQDLCQDIFIKIWNGLDRFRGDSTLSTWIYRIAVNTCLMHLRSKKILTLEDRTLTDTMTEPDDTEYKFKLMYECINQLKPIDKSIILMELQDIPQEDIAAIMDMRHEAVRTRIHRIKTKLSKCVNHV
jgi:RNA polymerase sigma factor (sigma-70 family)